MHLADVLRQRKQWLEFGRRRCDSIISIQISFHNVPCWDMIWCDMMWYGFGTVDNPGMFS